MKSTSIFRYSAIIFVFVLAQMTTAGEHAIRLQRSYRKNMVTRETFTVTNQTVSGPVGKVPKESSESIVFTCHIKVKELKSGRWQRLIVTPETVDATPKSLIDGVSIIKVPMEVARGAESVMFKRVDGKPIKDADRTLLARFFVMPNPHSQDDVFGTNETVDVKGTWQLNKARVAKLLNDLSGGMFSCGDDDAAGTMTLAKLWKTRDVDLLQVNGAMTFKNVRSKGPIAGAFDEPKVAANFAVTFHLPTDVTLPAFKTEGKLTWRASGVKKGSDTQFVVAGQLTRQHQLIIIASGNAPEVSKIIKENTP